ncbi:hypothetical protein HY251_06215 [bacterium]|nr:hypothetical protein [bacterium]
MRHHHYSQVGPVLKRAVVAAAALALTAIAFGGCAYVVPTTPLNREPQDKWFAQDVPVPEGFKYVPVESLSEPGEPRNLKLVYRRESYIDMDRPWAFYQEALSGRGWQLQFLYGFDRRGMVFWKGSEELRVTLDRSYRATCVTAIVEVEPKDPDAAGPSLARRVE